MKIIHYDRGPEFSRRRRASTKSLLGVRAQEKNVLVYSDILKMKNRVAFAEWVGVGQGVKDKSLPYSRILTNKYRKKNGIRKLLFDSYHSNN